MSRYESRVPYDVEVFSPAGMNNLTYEICAGFEEALRSGPVFGRHAAWDFNGKVWFGEDGRFHEEVWVYGTPREVISADSLRDLMAAVNGKYGAD